MRNLWMLVFLSITVWGLQACKPSSDSQTNAQLANTYCGSCHLFPAPELLPKSQWENVLPRMGARLGMPSESFNPYEGKSLQDRFQLQEAKVYPTSPLLSNEAWEKIRHYFLSKAPDTLVLNEYQVWENQQVFRASFPKIPLQGFPAITMVEIDPEYARLYLSGGNGNFLKLTSNFELVQQIALPRPIVEVERIDEVHLQLLSIGNLYPHDFTIGAVIGLNDHHFSNPQLLFEGLRRPVNTIMTDIDGDGINDHVICAYGDMMGELLWYKKTAHTYSAHLIKQAPGATRVYADDLDGNGYQDLVVLFAQGDEGVSIFYNTAGDFREEKVLRFHPLYGCNDLQFLDFDGDGYKDLIITNGDNADYSNVLKPYHGVRVYLNDGHHKFEEKYFFPFYGASKVRCADFDLDGDMDMVAMSFFPDYSIEGTQSLVYLENRGNWRFIPYQFPEAAEGRWMVMEIGDLDQDGDEDLVVGSFVLTSASVDSRLLNKWKRSDKKILFLENQKIRRSK